MRPYGFRQLCPPSGYKSLTANSCQCSFSSAWVLCLVTTISKHVNAGQRRFAGLCALLHELQCHQLHLLAASATAAQTAPAESSPWHGQKGPDLTAAASAAQSLSEAARAALTLASPGSNRHPQCPQEASQKCPNTPQKGLGVQEGIKRIVKKQKLLHKLLCISAACWAWLFQRPAENAKSPYIDFTV